MKRNSRTFSSGILEWFGYYERAQGWLFVGSLPELHTAYGDRPLVVARGSSGEMRGDAAITLFDSAAAPSAHVGFAAFVNGKAGFLNELGTLLIGDDNDFVEITVPYRVPRRTAGQIEHFLADLYGSGPITEIGRSLSSIIEQPGETGAGEAAGGEQGAAPSTARRSLRAGIAGALDTVLVSRSGAVFFVGWADDRFAPIHSVSISFEDGSSTEIAGSQLMRLRRPDAEEATGISGYHLGYCGLALAGDTDAASRGRATVLRLATADGAGSVYPAAPQIIEAGELRDRMLGYLGNAGFLGDARAEAFFALDGHLGDALIRYNLETIKPIVEAATVERFGDGARPYKASLIVCLYGKAEFQFLQNALFSAGRAAAEVEYIYVSNSPELLETMRKTAVIAQRVHGLDSTLVMLPANAGFGAANNAAARHARSDRLMIVNPDVFPMRRDWAERHEALLAGLPKQQSRLFGPRLFYADGSLMHAGMYFDLDTGLSLSGPGIRRRPMLRVEHYGKGAPGSAAEFLGSRPVPAVSGAFISIDRSWFERLGGFCEDYIYGHYEDADLCLRSLDQGAAAWVHDLEFWHLEGKGSTRLPHHDGASAVNRWLFTRRWHDRVVPGLLGRVSPSPHRTDRDTAS